VGVSHAKHTFLIRNLAVFRLVLFKSAVGNLARSNRAPLILIFDLLVDERVVLRG